MLDTTPTASQQVRLLMAAAVLGHYDEAISCYERALDLFQKAGDRFNAADTLTRCGDSKVAIGLHDSARQSWEYALDILIALRHPDAAHVRTKLSDLDVPRAEPCSPD
jgi:tetratricopeptide (TPR) repeat protein